MKTETCKRCGCDFEPVWLEALKQHSAFCEPCGVRNLFDGLGVVTPAQMADRYTLKQDRRPINRAQFENRRERLIKHARENPPMMWRIEPMLVFEIKLLLEAYYGGKWREVWALAREAANYDSNALITSARIKICDWAGWTKLYYYPETETMVGHWQRHGRKCSGSPNCNNHHCIDDSIPGWFKWLTRWPSL